MEYVVKNLNDRYIEKYLHSVIDSALSTDFKVDRVKNLIDDVINDYETIYKVFENRSKLESIVDRICYDRTSKISHSVLEKLNDYPLELDNEKISFVASENLLNILNDFSFIKSGDE